MFECKVISNEKILFDGNVSSIYLPGIVGDMEILENHAEMYAQLKDGEVKISAPDGIKEIKILKGTVKFANNAAQLFVFTGSDDS